MLLIYLVFGWTAGLITANLFPVVKPLTWLILVAGCLCLVWYTRTERRQRTIFWCFLFLSLAGLRYSFVPQTSTLAAYNDTGGLTIEGVVSAPPDIRDDRTLLRVDADLLIRGADVQIVEGAVLVRAARTTQVTYGDRVRVTGLLLTPQQYDTFSYADYLARQGVFSLMRDTSVEVLSSGHGNPLIASLTHIRQQAALHIALNLPEPQAGLLMGILLGDESSISPQLEDAFSASGAAHVIAISGFNMVLLSSIVMRLLSQITRRRVISLLVAGFVIILYTIFVGANGAVLRAAFMTLIVLTGESLRRKSYLPASLALSVLLITAHDPNMLWDVSFQLSFFATLGIGLLVDPFSRNLNRVFVRFWGQLVAERMSAFLLEPLVVTTAALVTTMPLIILYFQRLSLLVLPVNLLILPVQSYILIFGGIALITSFVFPLLAQVIFWLTMILLSWTIGVVRFAASIPFVDVEFYVHPGLITLFFLLLFWWAVMNATRPAWWNRLIDFMTSHFVFFTMLYSSSALLLLMIAIYVSFPDGKLHVWFLDVGHSNAVLLQTPGGAQILIDGGRYPSRLMTAVGDRMPFNDREIDLLFITHPDEFDTGALPSLLDRYATSLVLTHGQPNQTANFSEIQARLSDRLVTTVTAGYTLDFNDGVQIEVLHPQIQPAINDSLNDNALVLRVTYGDVSFLLTSDVSPYGQKLLLEGGQWPLATVFQVPQHGTARALDSAFVEAIQPSAIVIQSDKGNLRGDPDIDTLAMLPDAPLYRTDEKGTIHFWTDGEKLWVLPEG